ncbi:MAG: prepilin-type N-terminal cleavage/methylation domain-containing protein [Thermoguttaceae bacterium]
MKRGYTLLEVLIALALLTVVLTIVGTSLQQYWRFVSIGRTTVVESELARAILELIARDLRNVLMTQSDAETEVDTAAITGLSDPAAVSALTSSITGTSASTESGDAATIPESGTIVGSASGVYGTTEWIQIDTTRLPRGEQGRAKVWRPSASPLTDRVSPSKNVLYYLGRDTGTTSDAASEHEIVDSLGRRIGLSAQSSGLFRRAFDRSVTELMLEDGSSESVEIEAEDELLASEVEAIEFLYFDPNAGQEGTAGDWVEEWDMDELGALPKAVKVTLWMRRKPSETRSVSTTVATTASGQRSEDLLVFSLIVALPVFPESPSATTEESAAAATTGAATGSTVGASSR